MRNTLFLILAIILLNGCKAGIKTTVKMSELLNKEEKKLQGIVSIQIPSCNSYEDSRKQSRRLLDLQLKIPSIIPDAKYSQCYTKKFKSYAEFLIPIQLTKGNKRSTKYFGIGTDKTNLLYVYIPKRIQDGISKIQETSLIVPDMKVEIELINDLGKPSPKFTALSIFVKNEPIIVGQKIWLKKGSKPIITLSDVSVQTALQFPFALVLLKN